MIVLNDYQMIELHGIAADALQDVLDDKSTSGVDLEETTKLCMSIVTVNGPGLTLTSPVWVHRFKRSLGHILERKGVTLMASTGNSVRSQFDIQFGKKDKRK